MITVLERGKHSLNIKFYNTTPMNEFVFKMRFGNLFNVKQSQTRTYIPFCMQENKQNPLQTIAFDPKMAQGSLVIKHGP